MPLKNLCLLTLIPAFCLVFITSSAQPPPGYMGKRLMINYNNFSFPSLSTFFKKFELEFHQKNNIELELVLTRKKTIGISATFYSIEIPFQDYTLFYRSYNPYLGSYDDYYIPQGSGSMSATHAGIFYRIFHGQNVAPIGFYSQLGLDGIFHNITYPNSTFQQETYSNKDPPDIQNKGNYTSVMFSYSVGTQRVLLNFILVRFGIKTGYVLGGLKTGKGGFLEAIGSGLNEENYIKRVSKRELLNHNFFNVVLGFGLLVH